jgi:type I restriction enzyme S subunit
MRGGWQNDRLYDVCDLITCGVAAKPNYVDTGVPFLSAKNVKNGKIIWSGYNCVSEKTHAELTKNNKPLLGDILYTRVGSFGEAAVIEDEIEFSVFVSLTLIKPKKNLINNHFLKYYLNSSAVKELAIRSISSSGVGNLNVGTVREFPIYYPPLPEQQRIVGILDEAFDGIATAKANAEKNLQNARAIFESHLQSIFTQCGEVWARTTIGEQVMLQRGFDITKDEQHEGSVPVVSSGGIKSYHNKAMVQSPGVVIGRKGTLGKAFYLETDFWPHDTTLWVKDFKGNNPRFVYYLFTGLDVKRLDSGTANPALNRNLVHPIEVCWPPTSRQKAIVEKLDELSSETQRLESIYQQKLAVLDELKKSLLNQAFSGGM